MKYNPGSSVIESIPGKLINLTALIYQVKVRFDVTSDH